MLSSSRPKLRLIFHLAIVVAGLVLSANAEMNDRTRVLNELGSKYQRIVDTQNILFDVDEFRVIRAIFDEQNRLIELAVEPKYYFEGDHQDWTQRKDHKHLTRAEFDALVSELAKIMPLGKKVAEANKIAFVTNMTAWYTEHYQNASLTWGVVVDSRSVDDSYEVRWFRFKYGANADKPSEQLERVR